MDIDPKAVGVAYENAGMNGIGRDRYTVRAGDVLSDKALAAELAERRYELVLANIAADVIPPSPPRCPACWLRAAHLSAPASSTAGPTRSAPPSRAGDCPSGEEREKRLGGVCGKGPGNRTSQHKRGEYRGAWRN